MIAFRARMGPAKKLVCACMVAGMLMAWGQADGKETEPYSVEKISFKSGKNTLRGFLFTPREGRKKYKAVTLIGPVAFVKEQAPFEYAKTLASKGYKALIFDPTYHGESDGLPRRLESGNQKIKDISASIDYLESLDDVDGGNIFGVGICQGVNWMIKAANQDDRIKSVSLVAGHYLVPEVAEKYTGGKKALAARLSKAQEAKAKFEATGEADYIPIVSTDNPSALLLPRPIHDWYIPWASNEAGRKGLWQNRITRMSELEIWGTDIAEDLARLKKPVLLIHSDRAASGPVVPKQLFDVIPASKKKLVWFEDQFQMLFYDNSTTIERAVSHIDKWFENTSKR